MLEEILASADRRAAASARNIDRFVEEAAAAGAVRSFRSALSGDGLAVVAEIKRRSPSAGLIATDMDPVEQARAYERGGADAISVLTEPHFFDGSLDDLTAVREAVSVPVLRKDFTRNGAQIWEARAAGADAVLLIVAALDDRRLAELVGVAAEVGVDAIVEAHSLDEVQRAAAVGASIIGVNNRDLTTFVTDLAVAESVARFLPTSVLAIAESGVSDAEGARRMRLAGYDAILVGEALVRHADPAALVAQLKSAS
jgi:indole-3-glycerol phosphate synthase